MAFLNKTKNLRVKKKACEKEIDFLGFDQSGKVKVCRGGKVKLNLRTMLLLPSICWGVSGCGNNGGAFQQRPWEARIQGAMGGIFVGRMHVGTEIKCRETGATFHLREKNDDKLSSNFTF